MRRIKGTFWEEVKYLLCAGQPWGSTLYETDYGVQVRFYHWSGRWEVDVASLVSSEVFQKTLEDIARLDPIGKRFD